MDIVRLTHICKTKSSPWIHFVSFHILLDFPGVILYSKLYQTVWLGAIGIGLYNSVCLKNIKDTIRIMTVMTFKMKTQEVAVSSSLNYFNNCLGSSSSYLFNYSYYTSIKNQNQTIVFHTLFHLHLHHVYLYTVILPSMIWV